MPPEAIPLSVLAVLQHRWTEANPSYSSFEAVFNGAANEGKRSDPSWYQLRPGKTIENSTDVLTHAEAAALAGEAVFGSAASVRADRSVLVNEHAQHAFTDFCAEVYAAWNKHRRRIAAVEAACPAAGD